MADVIDLKLFLSSFNTSKTSPILGAILPTFAGGACIGALTGELITGRLGRRHSIQIGALACVADGILQAAAVHSPAGPWAS